MFCYIHRKPQESLLVKNLAEKMSTLEIDETCDETDNQLSAMLNESIGNRILRNRKNTKDYDNNSRDSFLHGVKRRSIVRPPKIDTTALGELSPKSLKKIYLNKTTGRLKRTNLETIFEEDAETATLELDATSLNDAVVVPSNNSKLFGVRKIKRELTFSNGFCTKALKAKRQKRVKLMLGQSKKVKKISMDVFMQYFQTMSSATATIENCENENSNQLTVGTAA